MTKSQEIKLLDQMIKKFGEDSYIGPFLKQMRGHVIYTIENDLNVATAVGMVSEQVW